MQQNRIRQDDFHFPETPNSAWAWELNELIRAGELIIYRSENGTHYHSVFSDWSAEEQAEAWLTPGYTDPLAMGSSIHERLYSDDDREYPRVVGYW